MIEIKTRDIQNDYQIKDDINHNYVHPTDFDTWMYDIDQIFKNNPLNPHSGLGKLLTNLKEVIYKKKYD